MLAKNSLLSHNGESHVHVRTIQFISCCLNSVDPVLQAMRRVAIYKKTCYINFHRRDITHCNTPPPPSHCNTPSDLIPPSGVTFLIAPNGNRSFRFLNATGSKPGSAFAPESEFGLLSILCRIDHLPLLGNSSLQAIGTQPITCALCEASDKIIAYMY